MSDFRGQILSGRGGLKNLLSKVPGFKGYIENEDRRTADKLLRDAIADRYSELWKRLTAIQSDFVNQGKISYLDDLESVSDKLKTFIDRIRHATYGYSSFFSAIKIDQTKLDKLYEYDNALLNGVDELASALDTLEFAGDDEAVIESIRNINGIARDSVQAISRRKEVITGGVDERATSGARELPEDGVGDGDGDDDDGSDTDSIRNIN